LPAVGSAPFTAYDDYMRGFVPAENADGKVSVVITPSAIEAPRVVVVSTEPTVGTGSRVGGAD